MHPGNRSGSPGEQGGGVDNIKERVGQEIRNTAGDGGRIVLGTSAPGACFPAGPDKFLPAGLTLETATPLPCYLAGLLEPLKQDRPSEIAYILTAFLYRYPFQRIALPYRYAALARYRSVDIKHALSFLEAAGIIQNIQKGIFNQAAAVYCFAFDLALIYCNTEGFYNSYQQACTGRRARTRQTFSRGIAPASRAALMNLKDLSWNPEAALKVLASLPPEKQIQTWPYIAYIQGGKVKPDWYQAPTGRLYARQPAMQNLRKDFRRPGVISDPAANLYEVDYSAQEPNIALVMNGRKPEANLWEKIAGERKKELKPAFQGCLHGQHLGQYLHNQNEDRIKEGLPYSKEAEEQNKKDFAFCQAALIKSGVLRAGMTLYEKAEFGKELQRKGADILVKILETYHKTYPEGGLLLPLHDGIIGKGQPATVDDLFGEASRAVLGKELPRTHKTIPGQDKTENSPEI